MFERLATRLADGSLELPVFDGVALELERAAREDHLEIDEVCALLERDPAFALECLRIANTGAFLGVRPIVSLREAVIRLGLRQIALIAFSVEQKRLYSAARQPFRARLATLWRHVLCAAHVARHLATERGLAPIADDAYLAALVHDVGKLALLRAMELEAASAARVCPGEIDTVLDTLAVEAGERVLGAWNIPPVFGEVVGSLEGPLPARPEPLFCIVRLADRAALDFGAADRPTSTSVPLAELEESEWLGLDADEIDELEAFTTETAGTL